MPGAVSFRPAGDIPEAEIHIELPWPQRIERKAVSPRTGSNRANPDRRDANLALEKAQKRVRMLERDIDVLDHRFGVCASAPQPVPRLHHAPSRVPAHEPLVRSRAKPPASEQAPKQRILRTDVLRAPEPIGVPAPNEIVRRQVIELALLERTIINPLVRVIARVRRRVGEAADVHIELVRPEYDAVDEIVRRCARGIQRREKFIAPGVAPVRDLDEGFRSYCTRRQLERVTKSAVRVGKAEEQIGMFVVGTADEHAAIARQDLQLIERFVHETELERRCLNADARCRAAESYGLELGNDRRQKPLRQRCGDKVFVCDHAFRFDDAGRRIDTENVIEVANVEAALRAGRTIAEEIGRVLAKSNLAASGVLNSDRDAQDAARVILHVSRRFATTRAREHVLRLDLRTGNRASSDSCRARHFPC